MTKLEEIEQLRAELERVSELLSEAHGRLFSHNLCRCNHKEERLCELAPPREF